MRFILCDMNITYKGTQYDFVCEAIKQDNNDVLMGVKSNDLDYYVTLEDSFELVNDTVKKDIDKTTKVFKTLIIKCLIDNKGK